MKSPFEPRVVADDFGGGLAVDPGVEEVGNWVAEWLPQMAMLVTAVTWHAGFGGELGLGAVFVEAGHGEPAVGGDALGVVHGDEAVGVAGIADDEDAHIGGGVFFDGLALADEDLAVDAEQVPALHPGFAGHAADEQRPVHVLEAFIEIGGGRRCRGAAGRRSRRVP